MLYNRLTTDELERAVYVDPANLPARAEMLARVGDLLDEQCDAVKEAEEETASLRSELDESEKELEISDTALNAALDKLAEAKRATEDLTAALAAASARISDFTSCFDLV